MREIAGTCTHVCLSVNVVFFPPPPPLMCLLCWGKHLQLLPNCWSASLLPCCYPQPGVCLGGNVAYNGPRVNHLQVSLDNSQCVCCTPSKSQQQLWGCAEGSLWHLERWPRWEAVCFGGYLNTTIWSASVALKALVWVSNGHSLEMPKNEPSLLDGQMAWRQWNLLIIWASCLMYCLNSKGYQNTQGGRGEGKGKSGGKGGGGRGVQSVKTGRCGEGERGD